MMSDAVIRKATTDDRHKVAELCRDALLPIDVVDPAWLDRVVWDSDGISGSVAVVSGELVGAVFGSVKVEHSGTVAGAMTLLCVREDRRCQGLGSGLVAEMESAMKKSGATEVWTGGGQPRFWWPGIDSTSAEVLSFFVHRGYELDDDAVNMRVDLSTADLEPREPNNVDLHRLTAAEWPKFLEWMELSWDDPWSEEVESVLQRQPVSCFVAKRAGEYIGFAAYDTNRRGWFGPMGSRPDARGTGIGGELLRLCLRDYVDQGREDCEIGWVGPLNFYENAVGATVARKFSRLRKGLQP